MYSTDLNADYHELFGDEPGPPRQTRVLDSPQQNRQRNIFSTQDTLVSTPNITVKSGHNEVPSHQNSPMFPAPSPWPSPIQPRASSQPSPTQTTGPQALSSPPRYRSQRPASRVKTTPQGVPPAAQPSNSKRSIPKMAARRPRALMDQNIISQSKTRSADSIDIPGVQSKRQKTNGTKIVEISDMERVEENPIVAVSGSHPSRDSVGKGRARKNSPIASQVERSRRQPVEQDPRSPSMDTDDAQINGDLFTNQSQLSFFRTGFLKDSSPLEPPSQFLESWEASPDRGLRKNDPFMSQRTTSGRHYQTPNRGPFTPTFSHSRARSTSSDESFPIKGTKASVYKEIQTQKAKHTPYQPLEGTRASQFTN